MAVQPWDVSGREESSYLPRGLIWFVCGFVSAILWLGAIGLLMRVLPG